MPEQAVVLTVAGWQGEILVEFTLGELKKLKRLIEDEN